MTVRTAEALALLPRAEWTVFNDVPWPGRRKETIGHVAVGPGGVFVIDSADLTRRRQVRRDVLRSNGRLHERTVDAATKASDALLQLLPELEPWRVRPVVCFARERKIMGWAQKVMVCSTSSLVPMILTHPTALDAQDSARTTAELQRAMSTSGVSRAKSRRRRAAKRRRLDGRAMLSAAAVTLPAVAVGVLPELGQHLSVLVG